MNSTGSDTDNTGEEVMRDLHAALDALEDRLRRSPGADRIGPHAMDLVLRLRREITTPGFACPGRRRLREGPCAGVKRASTRPHRPDP